MHQARGIYTDHLRTRILLCIWCALAAVVPAEQPVASQSSVQPSSYLPLVVPDVAPPQQSPTPTSSATPQPTSAASATPQPTAGPSPTPQPAPPTTVFGMVMSSIAPERGF